MLTSKATAPHPSLVDSCVTVQFNEILISAAFLHFPELCWESGVSNSVKEVEADTCSSPNLVTSSETWAYSQDRCWFKIGQQQKSRLGLEEERGWEIHGIASLGSTWLGTLKDMETWRDPSSERWPTTGVVATVPKPMLACKDSYLAILLPQTMSLSTGNRTERWLRGPPQNPGAEYALAHRTKWGRGIGDRVPSMWRMRKGVRMKTST